MRRRYLLIGMALLALPLCAFGQWAPKATAPAWFPYDPNWQHPYLTIPTIGNLYPNYAAEPLGLTQGWWPRGNTGGIFANGRYYVLGGVTETYDANYDGDGDPNTGYGNYWANRQSGADIYNPWLDTWVSSKWDGTGPQAQTWRVDRFGEAFMETSQVVPAPPGLIVVLKPGNADFWDLNAAQNELRYQFIFRDMASDPGNEQVLAYIQNVKVYFGVPGVAGTLVKTLWQDANGPANPPDWPGRITGFWTGLTPANIQALKNGELYIEVVADDNAGNVESILRGQIYYLKSNVHYSSTRMFAHAVMPWVGGTWVPPNIPWNPVTECPYFEVTKFVRDSTNQDPTYALKLDYYLGTKDWQNGQLAQNSWTIQKVTLRSGGIYTNSSPANLLYTIWDTATQGPPPWDVVGSWTDNSAPPLTEAIAALLESEQIYVELETDYQGPATSNPHCRLQWQKLYDPTTLPRTDDGFYPGTGQTVAFDRNGDGTKEIYIHAGYPHWEGYFHIYDPADDTWTQSSWLPNWSDPPPAYKSQYLGQVYLYNNKMYCVSGGFWGDGNNDNVARYDPMTDSWELGNTALGAQTTGGFGGVLTNLVDLNDYAFATRDPGSGADTVIYKYNLTAASQPGGLQTELLVDTGHRILGYRLDRPSGFVWQNKLYILGGRDSNTGQNSSRVFVYDGTANATELPAMALPVAMSRHAAAVDPSSGKVYLGGGLQRRNQANSAFIYASELWVGAAPGAQPGAGDGDMNCDGVINAFDIDAFVKCLTTGTPTPNCPDCQNADINDDGVINAFDIDPFVICLTTGSC